MQRFYEDLLDRFHELHQEVLKALEENPPEALDWIPGPEMNSLTVLIVHLSGAERFWVGDIARRDPSNRDREAEFQTHGLNGEALKRRVTDLEDFEKAAFESMRLAELEEERISPRDGRKYSVTWALCHALEHTALHVGHIQIVSQLWKSRHPVT